MWLRKESVSLRIAQIENFKTEKQREQRLKKEKGEKIQSLWDNYETYNIHVMSIAEGEEREKGTEEMFGMIMNQAIVKEHFLSLESGKLMKYTQKYFRIAMGHGLLCAFCFSAFLIVVSVTVN